MVQLKPGDPRLVSCVFVVSALLVSLLSESVRATEVCNSIGTPSTEGKPTRLKELSQDPRAFDERLIEVEGFLLDNFEIKRLCPSASEALPAEDRAPSCIWLDYGWLRGLRHLPVVLRQWNGGRVRATGTFEVGSGVRSLTVHHMQILDSEPSEAFCPGYEGPLVESAAEDAYDRQWHLNRAGQTELADGGILRLHVYKAIAGYFPQEACCTNVPAETIPFSVPRPYSGRDIESFGALSMSAFVFSLRNGRLYLWASGKLRELDGPRASVVQLMADGNLYYTVRYLEDHRDAASNALRRVRPDFSVETVWESSAAHIGDIELLNCPDEGLMKLHLLPTRDETLIVPFPSKATRE